MTDDERRAAEGDREANETLDDLEPTDDDANALKGGGPKSESSQTGSDPEDLRGR